MKPFLDRYCPFILLLGAGLVVTIFFGFGGCSGRPQLESWHTEKLDSEFTADLVGKEVRNFGDYLELERALFHQLDSKVYSAVSAGPEQVINRYSPGSRADPRNRKPEWNRTFELTGRGGRAVLLLHGMSDSPYSLRAIGETLNQQGFHVLGLRLPGHGTAPSGLKHVDWRDMAAAVRIAMDHLQSELGFGADVHIVGYSTGASLALGFTLEMLETGNSYLPASLVLVSPAIRVHGAARFAGAKNGLSSIPGLGNLAWLSVMAEFDPYKYNSFATNAGTQVHQVTVNVDRRMKSLAKNPQQLGNFPPVLVFKSAVDSTVTTEAVVDDLLMLLPGGNAVSAKHKPARQAQVASAVTLESSWPRGMVSLSHVALPFPADDPLYGQAGPPDDGFIYLGNLAVMGERGLLKISPEWLLRTRYNPFFPYLEERLVNWFGCPQTGPPGCRQ